MKQKTTMYLFCFTFSVLIPCCQRGVRFALVQNCIVCALVCNLMYKCAKMYCVIRFFRSYCRYNIGDENNRIGTDYAVESFVWSLKSRTANQQRSHTHAEPYFIYECNRMQRTMMQVTTIIVTTTVVVAAATSEIAIDWQESGFWRNKLLMLTLLLLLPKNEVPMICTVYAHRTTTWNIWECVCDKINQEMKYNKYVYGKWARNGIALEMWQQQKQHLHHHHHNIANSGDSSGSNISPDQLQ